MVRGKRTGGASSGGCVLRVTAKIPRSVLCLREALQLSKLLRRRRGNTSRLLGRRAGSREAVLYARCVSACPARGVGCFVLVQDSDGGTEWERLKRNLFASLGLLALTLCGSLGDDGTNC